MQASPKIEKLVLLFNNTSFKESYNKNKCHYFHQRLNNKNKITKNYTPAF